MNSAQLVKYHVNRRKWEAARRAAGRPCDEAALELLKQRTIGRACSSKKMRNAELDAMLAAFLSEAEPGNFDAQFELQESPEKRISAVRARIEEIAKACKIIGEGGGVERYFRHWFGGRTYAGLSECELQQLAGLLERRAEQLGVPVNPF